MALRSLRVLVGGIVVLFVAGCGGPIESDPDEEVVVDTSAAIKGGYTDGDDSAAVGIADFQHGAICTGSLIGPNLVLTARHCVSNTQNDSNGVICTQTTAGPAYSPKVFGVTTLANLNDTGFNDWRDVVEVVTLPTDSKFCGQDEAILILADNIPASEATPYVPRVDSALAKNEEYDAIGYGVTSDNDTQGTTAGQRRRRDSLFVDCAETDCMNVGAYVKESEWIGDTGICSGDSGGPALDLQGRVVGVTSRGGAGCTSPVYGSVHSWGDWIKTTAVHAAEVGGYDPPLWATGWPTDPNYNYPVGGECGDCPICVSNQCSRFCSDDAPCPTGYECADVSGKSVCKPKPKAANDDGGDSGDGTSCSISDAGRSGADPTNPVPWFAMAFSVTGLALGRRLRIRKQGKPRR